REDYAMTLVQLYMRQEKLAEARQVVEPLARDASRPEIRSRAESMLETIARIEQFKATGSAPPVALSPSAVSGETSTLTPSPPTLRRRFEGEKVEGLLTRIDCEKGMTLTVKSGDKTIKLNTASPDRVKFISYVPDNSGEITCGPINPAKQVVVTYRASTDAKSAFIGEPIAVEFVKSDGK
ncbi:MAG: hypothetical protein J2P52_14620, partial [Blastocatellia bacterium]|nr:hypothetical protein [Blastocatellia bacterium]